MPFYDWIDEQEKKKKKTQGQSFYDWLEERGYEDIAPVRTQSNPSATKESGPTSNYGEGNYWNRFSSIFRDSVSQVVSGKNSLIGRGGNLLTYMATGKMPAEPEDTGTWFKPGLIGNHEEGDFWGRLGDNALTVLGSAADVGINAAKGAGSLVEGIVDLALYNESARAKLYGDKATVEDRKRLAQRNFVDEWLSVPEEFVDQASVFGDKSDAVAQGVGQVGAIMLTGGLGSAGGLSSAGVTALTTGVTGLSSTGRGIGEAYQGGATDEEAYVYGLATGAAEAFIESLSGGLGKGFNAVGVSRGLGGVDDILAKKISGIFKSQIAKNLAEAGVKATGEGLEEVATGFVQALAKKATYMSKEDLGKIIADENLLEQFIVGAITSGIVQSPSVVSSTRAGRDFVTGLSKNEQAVIDKEVENRISRQGDKLTGKEKSRIYDEVVADMERGYISTETIESVLGKDALTQYDALSQEAEEFKTLYETESGKLSEKQKDRLAELKEKNKANPYEQLLKSQRAKISKDVSALAQNDRLGESYGEQTRKNEKFQADVTKYSEAQRKTVQNAIDSGILNNTNRSHEFVDLVAKISADKGISFDFADNAKLKESGFALDGVLVNGFVNENGVTINIQSAKALNRVVGHEITHVLEGTELYDALQSAVTEYAKGKKEYDSRRKELTKLYEGKNANVEQELVADLVGDYLFTDADFIRHLSTEHRNLAQKIYDEIKYLCKIVTAGTKEARQLEKVKKTFAEMYREGEIKNPTKDGGVRYSIVNLDTGKSYVQASRQVIHGNSVAEWRSQISEFFNRALKNGPIEIETIEGDMLTISKNTAEKARSKTATENGVSRELTDKEFLVKLHAEAHIDELAEISHKNKRPPVPDGKNHSFAKDGFTYRTVYFQDFDGSYYRITLSVGENNGISTVYNVGKIKADDIPDGNIISTIGSKADMSSTKFSISRTSENVNNKKSLSTEGETAAQDGWRVSGADVTLDEQAAVAESGELSSDSQVAEQNGLPEDSEPVAENEQEKPDELYGPWRMADPLDQKVEKLYRMMLREEISEEDYVAQLVKADRLYQKRGEQVEAALERVRDAYSRNSASSADSDQMTVPPETETKMTRLTRKVLHTSIMEKLRGALENAGFDLNELLSKAKRLSTFATVDNTPQRVIEKTFGYKAGQIINDLTVNKVALNESEGIQWLNGRVEAIKNLSKKYGIKPGSKESRAAQIYGEGFWVNEAGEYITYGDMELAADFPDVKKQERIKKLAKDPEVRKMYDETLEAINETRVRNGYPPIPKRADYFLHFRAMDDTFSRLGVPFNPNDIKAKDLPTDLNGMTADLKPGKPFFASEMHRKGDRTTYDLLGGLERYMNSAKNQIYHIDDIQTFRAFRNYIADMYGQTNGLSDLDSLSPEEQEIRIKEVFDGHLSTFAKFLNEEANVLAGKTALIDRGIEGVLGRRAIQFLHTLNSQVGKNMVGWNVSSAGTNVLPIVQAMAKLPKADMLKAFAQTISNKFQNDGFVESNPALIRRRGADQFAKTFWQKISDPGYALMSAVDNLSSEVIVRAKYNELVRKQGMDNQQAHIRAGEWASRLMGDRSLGQMPQLYNSKTLGLITKFQLEVRNQLDVMGYDTIQEANAEGTSTAQKAAKITSTMVQLALFQHLFGQAYEAIAGYNPAFDIVENLIKLFGFDDDEESEDTFGDNLEQALLGLFEDLPYASTILNGGRIPIGSALPIEELVTGKDSYGNEKDRLETIGEALPYYILPGGYGQIKKTAAGLQMFDENLPVAGSYTDSGNLRFPVEATAGNVAQAAVFGQYASQNAREYFDKGYAPLKKKQIQEFKDVSIPIKDYWKYREGLREQETIEDKFDYIAGLDLPVAKKNILINNIVDREESVDMEGYEDFSGYEEFDFATKNPERYTFAKAVGGYDSYKTYSDDLRNIHADKDKYGKTISDSRKQKVLDYINNLDADYYTKIILFKSEYPSDDTYNMEIIDYLNGRDDISYNEMASILRELGFTVDTRGYIYWD